MGLSCIRTVMLHASICPTLGESIIASTSAVIISANDALSEGGGRLAGDQFTLVEASVPTAQSLKDSLQLTSFQLALSLSNEHDCYVVLSANVS